MALNLEHVSGVLKTATATKAVVDTTKHVLNGVPSWLLGGTLGAAAGMFTDDEDRLRGAMHGAGIGAVGGYMWDRLPNPTNPQLIGGGGVKVGFFSPSLSSGGSIGISYSGGNERMPGTSRYTSHDVIERAGKALDQGGSYEDIVAAGAKSPKTRYLPMASAVLGGLVGRSLSNTPAGWLGGGAAGLAAGYMGRGRLQHSIDDEASEATKGLLLEHARMGDPHAQSLILQHHRQLFPASHMAEGEANVPGL